MSQPETLGHVKVSSGRVLVIDMGLLNLWSHDREPKLPEGSLPPQALEIANRAKDLRIEGPDALRAGVIFAKQPNPLYLYDIVPNAMDEIQSQFNQVTAERNLKAELKVLPNRVSHLERLNQTLDPDKHAGVVFFHGIDAIAVDSLPKGIDLPVLGQRMGDGDFKDRWRSVYLQASENQSIAKSSKIGTVSVDRARLMFVDPDSLGSWIHDDTIDGKADFVFWGKDARDVAITFNAGHLADDAFGWMNQPVAQAIEMGLTVEDYRTNANLKFACDFRPHSHHYEMMKQVRETPTESGTLEVGECKTCGFMTSWGDGFFPVFVDWNNEGAIARVRIELGTEDTLKRELDLNSSLI